MSKTRTGRRFLSLLLTLCMVLSLAPALGITVSASGLDGTVLTIDSTDPASGTGWNWDGSTLTLSGVSLTQLVIGLNTSVTIVLEGANMVVSGSGAAISANGNLSIQGSGTLEVQGTNNSINVSGTLTISSGYIEVKSATANKKAISCRSMNVTGGYLDVSTTAVGSAIFCGSSPKQYSQSGGYVKASNVGSGSFPCLSASTVTVSGGYLEASATGTESVCIFALGGISNTGGVIKATSESYDGIATSTNANFAGGVTIVKTTSGESAISGNIINGSDGETLFDNTGESVAQTGTVLTSSKIESNLQSVVIAKSVTAPEVAGSTLTLNGHYLYSASALTLNAVTLGGGANVVVDGGSYIENAASAFALNAMGKQVDVNATLVCTSAGAHTMNAATLNVPADATLVGISGTKNGVYGTMLNATGGNCIGVSKAAGTGVSSSLNISGGYVCGVSEGNSKGISASVTTISGGYVTAKSAATTGTLSYAFYMQNGAPVFTGTNGGGYVTAVGTTTYGAYYDGANPPVAIANVAVTGTTDLTAAWSAAAFDSTAKTYKVNGTTAVAVFIKYAPPVRTFVLPDGTTVNEKPADPAWGDYHFAGWFEKDENGDYTGDALGENAGELGHTYYTRWKVSEEATKFIRTTPLDLSSVTYGDGTGWTQVNDTTQYNWVSSRTTDEGWTWSYNSAPFDGASAYTLTLDGAVIDCSNVTDCHYAINLPAGAIIQLADGTTSTVKGGYVTNYGAKLSSGLATNGVVSILGNGQLDVSTLTMTTAAHGDTAYTVAAYLSDSLTIGAANSRPTVNITANAAPAGCYGTNFGNLIVNNGNVTVTAGTPTNATSTGTKSYGILFGGLTVNGGSATVSCGTADKAYAIVSEDDETPTAGTLTTTGTVKAGENAGSASTPAGSSPYTLTDKWVNVSFVKYLSFDNRGGSGTEQVEIKADMTLPASPAWTSGDNTYSFGGWYTGIDGTGDEVTLECAKALEASTEVYAKWTSGGKTVRTTPLDCSTIAVNTDKLAAEGWTWTPKSSPAYNDSNPISADNNSGTLVLSGATIDCSAVTNSHYAVKLPAGAIIQLADGTTSTVKSGEGNFTVQTTVTYTASIGIMAWGFIKISGNGTLNAYAKAVTDTVSENQGASSYAIYAAEIGTAGVDSPVVNAYSGNATGSGQRANMSVGIMGAVVNSGKVYSSCGIASGGTYNYGFAFGEGGIVANNATVKGHAEGGKAITDLTAARIDGGAVQMGATEGDTVAGTAYITFGPSVTVASQTGALTYADTTNTATFAVASSNFTDTLTTDNYNIKWYSNVEGTEGETATAPTGVTLAKTDAATLTASIDATAQAGNYYFKLTAADDSPAESATSGVVTLSVDKAAPEAPTVASVISKTDTTVTLNAVTETAYGDVQYGYHASTDDASAATWGSSNVITGLTGGADYYFYVKYAGNDNYNASAASAASDKVTTKSAPDSAPEVGDAAPVTANSITLPYNANWEYCYKLTSAADYGEWQSGTEGTSNVFSGLTDGVSYSFQIRVKGTDDAMPSQAASKIVYTLPAAPATGIGYTIDYEKETISITPGYEVGVTDTIFSTESPIFTPGKTYYVHKAASGGIPSSEPTEFTVASRPTTPDALTTGIVGSKTDVQIVLTGTSALNEYKVGNEAWQTGNGGELTFTGLTANTEYGIVTRVKATDSKPASANSAPTLFVTTKQASSSVTTPDVGAAAPVTANSITLPYNANWEYCYKLTSAADYGEWQSGTEGTSNVFSGLTDGVSYSFQIRVKGTDDAMPSQAASKIVYTLPAAPATGIGYTIDYEKETISITPGYEVGVTDTIFSTESPIFTPGRTYYVRKALSGSVPASEPTEFTVASRPQKPDAPAAPERSAFTDISVTISVPAGCEYMISTSDTVSTDAVWTGGYKNSSDAAVEHTFTGLEEVTQYYLHYRTAATEAAPASEDTVLNIGVTKSAPDGVPTAPAKPVGDAVTTDSITLTVKDEEEYIISDSETAPTDWTNSVKPEADGPHTFSGLQPGKQYYIHFRTQDNGSAMPSLAGKISVATIPATPTAADFTVTQPTATSGEQSKGAIVPVDPASGKYEYRMKTGTDSWGGWTTLPTTGLSAIEAPATYELRVKATSPFSASAAYTITISKYSPPSSGGTPSVTVPATSDEGSVNVSATVNNGKANITVTDTQLNQIISNEEATGTVKVDVSTLKVDEAVIPAKLVTAAAGATGSEGLEVEFSTGSVTLDATALESIGSNSITVSVEDVKTTELTEAQKETLGDKADTALVVDVNVLVNGVKTSDFNGGVISVSVPYAPKTGEDTSKLVVWYLADDGSIEPMNGKYNAETKCYEFTTTHLSTYVLTSFPFTDVATGTYYYSAVAWAVAGGVTEGTSETTFSPDAICTRAQMVTFLWRALGSPEPTSTTCQFTDVDSNAYYYKAILWAAEKGITEGTSTTTFSPNDTVTRAQVVTLQWRTAGKPAAAVNPFKDVATGAYYADAVLWAVEEKITEGTSAATFSPTDPCTRAQIVTFLYRYLAK